MEPTTHPKLHKIRTLQLISEQMEPLRTQLGQHNGGAPTLADLVNRLSAMVRG